MPKYYIRASRFIDETFVAASPDFPAIIEVPEGSKVDAGMFPVDDPRATEKPKPHYAVREAEKQQSAAAHFSEPKQAPKSK